MTPSPNTQRFIPNSDPSLSQWVGAGTTPVNLQATDSNSAMNIIFDHGHKVYHAPGEMGPAILRPDGTVFATGAACTIKGPSTDPDACTVYQPGRPHRDLQSGQSGEPVDGWTKLPQRRGRGRYLASLLPNGNVLVQPNPPGITDDADHSPATLATRASAAARSIPLPPLPKRRSSHVRRPTSIKSTSSTAQNSSPSRRPLSAGQPNMLLLPTGEVMLDGQVNYKSTGTYQNSVEADDHDVHPEPL